MLFVICLLLIIVIIILILNLCKSNFENNIIISKSLKNKIPLWLLWPGEDKIPPYIELCIETCKKQNNDHFNIQIVKPNDMIKFFGELHPSFYYLRYAHRADYCRIKLLAKFGGCYLDIDSICVKPLFKLVSSNNNIDIITTGPKERNDLLKSNNLVRWESLIVLNKNNYYTQECYNKHEKYLTDNYDKLKKYNPYQDPKKDAFSWSEAMYELFKINKLNKNIIKNTNILYNKNFSNEYGYNIINENKIDIGDICVIILNNSIYNDNFKNKTREEILKTNNALCNLLREYK